MSSSILIGRSWLYKPMRCLDASSTLILRGFLYSHLLFPRKPSLEGQKRKAFSRGQQQFRFTTASNQPGPLGQRRSQVQIGGRGSQEGSSDVAASSPFRWRLVIVRMGVVYGPGIGASENIGADEMFDQLLTGWIDLS